MPTDQGGIGEKAREISKKVFGRTGKKKRAFKDALKEQVDLSAKFALEKALETDGLSMESKRAFVELLKEEKGAISLLMVSKEEEPKAVEMLRPLFGEKSGEFISNFRGAFNRLQEEIALAREKFSAS